MEQNLRRAVCVIDKEAELRNCTFVKTVLMLSIVFYHSIVFWRGDWNAAGIVPAENAAGIYWFVQWLASFQNYAFVLASGYLFYYVKYERGGYSSFGGFVKNKAKRLIVPFLFVGAIWVIPISWLYLKQDLGQTILDYILVQDAGQLWFLIMLFGVFLLAWLLSDFFAKHDLWGFVVVVTIYAFRFIGWRFIPGYFSVWNITKYLVVFWLGFKLRQGSFGFLRKIPLLGYIVLYTALMLGYECITLPHDALNKLYAYGMEFLAHGVGALMAFFLLQRVACGFRWRDSKIISFFTKNSMVIYLFHQQVIYFLVRGLNGFLNPYLHAGMNFIGAMVISVLIATILMKFRVTRFLVGEK